MKQFTLRRAIQALAPEDFELLVHEQLTVEHPPAHCRRKMRAPDGGADSVHYDAHGDVDWVVQVKRYTTFGAAQQRHAADSLQTALSRWAPTRMTFALALDFTQSQARRPPHDVGATRTLVRFLELIARPQREQRGADLHEHRLRRGGSRLRGGHGSGSRARHGRHPRPARASG